MPLLKLQTTAVVSPEKQAALLAELSQIIAGTIGKPEQYVMVTAGPAAIQMSGRAGDAAFVEVRSIGGLNREVNQRLAEKICRALTAALGVPAARIYLNFAEVDAENWGWNGSTFG
jgi:phenylpyruvate tautomerase PptA (4-oxalocrotonate tautomerase family)